MRAVPLLALLLISSEWAMAVRPRIYAIVGARIVTAPGRVLDRGMIVVRDGTIESVGIGLDAPADAEIIEGKGLTVYPGLIDAFTHMGMPKSGDDTSKEGAGRGDRDRGKVQEKPAERGPGRDNLMIKADTRAVMLYQSPSTPELDKMRSMGFTTVLTAPDAGDFRGTSALVHLDADGGGRVVLVPDVAAHMSLDTAPGDVYPSALMGAIALTRQSFLDADRYATWMDRWHKSPKGMERPPLSPSLEAIGEILHGRRVMYEADDTHAFGRIVAIAREFNLSPIVVGNGLEYEIEQQVKRSGYPIIVPVAFPEPPHVDDADASLDIKTRDLRRWDLAPWNLSVLHDAKVPIALTTYRLRSMPEFRRNLRKAIEKGFPADAALEALTLTPARMLGVDGLIGTIETGKIADLVLTDGDLFAERTKIRKVFVDGKPFEMEEESKDFDPNAKIDPRGTWEITSTVADVPQKRSWKISGSGESYSGSADTPTGRATLFSLALVGNKLTGSYKSGSSSVEFTWIIKGEELSGTSILADGTKSRYSGKRVSKPEGGGL